MQIIPYTNNNTSKTRGQDEKMSCSKKVRKLAKNFCATFEDTDGCMLTPLNRPDCVYFRHDQLKYRCKYFESHVLPSDPKLEAEYHEEVNSKKEVEKNIGGCEMCGKSYKKTSNRQKYCPSCKDRAETESRRKRDAKYRETKRLFREW